MRTHGSNGARPVRPALPAALAVALSTVGFAGPGSAQTAPPPQYDIIDIGTIDPDGSGAEAMGVNDTGQVVVQYGTSEDGMSVMRSFLYDITTGQMTDLGTLADRRNTLAWAVNDRQQVVGYGSNAPSVPFIYTGFFWDNGILTDLTPPGSSPYPYNTSSGKAINGAGQIAGGATVRIRPPGSTYDWDVPHAGVFSGGTGDWTDVGALFPWRYPSSPWNPSGATGINESGQVVGYFGGNVYPRGFLYTPGDPATWMELNPTCKYPADCSFYVYPEDINDRGQIVGYMSPGPGYADGFVYTNALETMPSFGGDWTVPYAINNSGQVVGVAEDEGGWSRPFLYQGKTMYDLDDLIPSDSGWTVVTPRDINDAGLIAGSGRRAGDSKARAVLLVPSPEQAVQGLLRQVEGLVPDPLNRGEANSLMAKLDAAMKQADKGNVDAAVNQLEAFINEVSAMVLGKRLAEATGAGLIDAATGLISSLRILSAQ